MQLAAMQVYAGNLACFQTHCPWCVACMLSAHKYAKACGSITHELDRHPHHVDQAEHIFQKPHTMLV